MTDSPSTSTRENTAREKNTARAKALQARREGGQNNRPSHTSSKIIAGGGAATACLLMVAAMAAADQPAAPTAVPQIIERVVVIEVPVQTAGDADNVASVGVPEPEITVIREVRTVPAPAQDATPAPAASEGS